MVRLLPVCLFCGGWLGITPLDAVVLSSGVSSPVCIRNTPTTHTSELPLDSSPVELDRLPRPLSPVVPECRSVLASSFD